MDIAFKLFFIIGKKYAGSYIFEIFHFVRKQRKTNCRVDALLEKHF